MMIKRGNLREARATLDRLDINVRKLIREEKEHLKQLKRNPRIAIHEQNRRWNKNLKDIGEQFNEESMLLKQQNQDDSPGLLITDNMFGEMSAPELIEPLFVAPELLKVQWITLCPPNIKLDITSKFDTVYSLDIGAKNGVNSIISKVQKYQRKFLHSRSAISHAKIEQQFDADESVS
ncbi:hypothetical protein [Paenibacillus sp. KN14-4R]|uniref:hypothetical protein n=1 Tax=Paenibacillus sp. KN14-4R TaxID=3445773 RepID=UPI003FA032A7